MKNKKKILVLCGGISKERPVSIQTGNACNDALKLMGYKTIKLDPKKNILKNIKEVNPDIVMNCLHGRYGEDGQIQKILEKLKVPYTHSGVKASEDAMNKIKSKKIFIKNRILTPNYKSIKKISDLSNKISKEKFIIKPANEGSSFGVKIFDSLNKKNLLDIKKHLLKYKNLIQEEFIDGQEVQTAILNNKVLGSVEIRPKRKFYDYKAKYSSLAKTLHVIPPKINKEINDKINKAALKAHKSLGCKGVTRSDFIVSKDKKVYILELNTQPGMTRLSLVPEIAKFYGLSFKKLVNWIVKDAGINR